MSEEEFNNDDWTFMTLIIRKSIDGIYAVNKFSDTLLSFWLPNLV